MPALYMCDRTLPRLGVSNPIIGLEKTERYWSRVKKNEHAAQIISEMDRGLKARLDGSEQHGGRGNENSGAVRFLEKDTVGR